MTSFNFSSIKDIKKNISLFDDKIFETKQKIESQNQESILDALKTQGILGLSNLKTPEKAALQDIKPKLDNSKQLDPAVNRFMQFLNNKVRIHGL